MSASTQHLEDGRWLASCEECDWLPDERLATDRDSAERSAAIHDSEFHSETERPEWADVVRWAESNRTAVPA